jgi:hypothetical protein
VRTLAAILLAAVMLVPAAPALGWANGGGDDYGTHDWIVDQALKVLDGRADDWFDARTARLASDDPDTVEVRDPAEIGHVYRDSGKRGGAVSRIADEYDLAQAAYQQGMAARAVGDASTEHDAFQAASYHIGLLSHFVGDISQPFHTGLESSGNQSLHTGYERLVSGSQRSASDRPEWQSTRRTVSAIVDVRPFAAATAAYSRTFYTELFHLLKRDGLKMTARVSAITGHVLRRAANDLADMIWSISRGVGAQPEVGSIKMSVKWTGVRSGTTNTVYVRAHDTAGKPIEGLRVVVEWPTATGTHIEYLYTDATGYQQRIYGAGTSPKLVLRPVVATATVRGVVTTATKSWTISPRLATGRAGFKTVVSDATPDVGQTVRVTSVARNAKGRGIPNLLVTWTWDFGSFKVKTKAYTDSSGRASSTQPITDATTTAWVTVTARTQSGSTNRSSSVTFRRTR